ncbi:MAG: S8 family serine peptidase [Cypionkella sp.]|nr:S8 family serine peptidase [Cypionkella sp.]
MMKKTYLARVSPAVLMAVALAGCSSSGTVQPWMSAEVKEAWDAGYKGQGATITVVDEHDGASISGNMTGVDNARSHGSWTALQSGLIAPEATVRRVDYYADSESAYQLNDGLNVINNSYAVESSGNFEFSDFENLEQTTIAHAHNGTAVVVKAAGNESTSVDGDIGGGRSDVFNLALTGAQSNIYVGALTKNGTTTNKAVMADYSNYAGSDTSIQNNFLVVGVDDEVTGLAGTSFAAPIVSGYAAILGSKFRSATPTQITDQLLNTARTDTIQGYAPSIHGQGEASLTRALAPNSLK